MKIIIAEYEGFDGVVAKGHISDKGLVQTLDRDLELHFDVNCQIHGKMNVKAVMTQKELRSLFPAVVRVMRTKGIENEN